MSNHSQAIISIIGAGSLGVGLAQLFSKNGFSIVIGSRNPDQSRNYLQQLLPKSEFRIESPSNAVQVADITLLTVPDDQIEKCCDSLVNDFKPGSVVAHCSGSHDSRVLNSARSIASGICSLHPLNSFPSIESSISTLNSKQHNTFLYCEGKPATLNKIAPSFEQCGFNIININQEDKPVYQAACVFACNYLTALMEVSMQTAEKAKLDRKLFWQSVQPLIKVTLDNINQHGTSSSLSGPIARGDVNTIRKHLAILDQTTLAKTYANLGIHALQLASKSGKLNSKQIKDLKKILLRGTHTHD